MHLTRLALLFQVLLVCSFVALSYADSIASLATAICGIVNAVRSIVGVIVVALFILAGITYAAAHFLPESVEVKKTLTTWAKAAIVGGVIGLLVVLIAQPLITFIEGLGSAVSGGTALANIQC